MFSYKKLTDFEKLVIANSYIKELKKQLRKQEKATKIANGKKQKFIDDFRALGPKFSKLASYRNEMIGAHKKNHKLMEEIETLRMENLKLKEKIRDG